jgi:hypothetical protein
VGQLAEYHKVNGTADELQSAYDMRSKLVHAQSFLYGLEGILPRAKHDPLYEKLELILRDTVRTGLLDEAYGMSFKDDASVCARWKL